MARIKTVLIPDGRATSDDPDDSLIYIANNAGVALAPGSRRAIESNPYLVVFDETGKPSNYQPHNNRHTIAIDVRFSGDYLTGCHLGLVSRHKGSNASPHVPGDNRGSAAILGNWSFGPGCVALEEIEITDDYLNGDSHKPPTDGNSASTLAEGVVLEGRWYRVVIESVSFLGQIGHRISVTDKVANEVVYSLAPEYWSDYSDNYLARDAGKVCIFSIPSGTFTNAQVEFSNLVSYWSRAVERIAKP